MKKEVSKWFIDVSKYVMALSIVGIVYHSLTFLYSILLAIILLLIGLYLGKNNVKKTQNSNFRPRHHKNKKKTNQNTNNTISE